MTLFYPHYINGPWGLPVSIRIYRSCGDVSPARRGSLNARSRAFCGSDPKTVLDKMPDKM